MSFFYKKKKKKISSEKIALKKEQKYVNNKYYIFLLKIDLKTPLTNTLTLTTQPPSPLLPFLRQCNHLHPFLGLVVPFQGTHI